MFHRRLPIGAEVQAEGGVHFRVWAPRRKTVHVAHERGETPLASEGNGYFSGLVASAGPGLAYRYRLDGGNTFPDPASRFQPEGPHGPSQVVDPRAFEWNDASWRGSGAQGQVIYEMHVGTFTREGTWRAACRELAALARLGITLLEVMPVAEFPGRFGWGYDGVNLFAPTRLYGTPDDFRHFADCAHREGMGVILDVVYNHLGPDGNYLKEFAAEYFTDRYENEWGEPINFDGPQNKPVREYFTANAGYWVDEFHLDGLRLDATQQIFDASPRHILVDVTARVHEAARGRATFIVAENEPQHMKLVQPPSEGGYGLDALWNDDFHHSAHVALTGHSEAYYSDYAGSPQELVSAVRHGFLYQGQWYSWQGKRRGTSSRGADPTVLVNYIQNHDQVANSARGLRGHLLSSPGKWRAITALLLLAPQTPMLFQGQEFSSSSPFLFFADHHAELARQIRKGRAEFLSQFPAIGTRGTQERLADPGDIATFRRCVLDEAERTGNREALALHADLLALRRGDAVFSTPRTEGVDGAVLSGDAFVLRFTRAAQERLLLVNLGRDLELRRAPQPLLAPPADMAWRVLWSSEEAKYGGEGTPPVERESCWRLPGESAVVMTMEPLQ
jgi:maltooligosyltrehalose trehalohydrolase